MSKCSNDSNGDNSAVKALFSGFLDMSNSCKLVNLWKVFAGNRVKPQSRNDSFTSFNRGESATAKSAADK